MIYLDIWDLMQRLLQAKKMLVLKADIKLEVVKNFATCKKMEASDNDYGDLPSALQGNSAIFQMLCKCTWKIIKDFRKKIS
jgi:large subunit ribosomal protein L10